MTQTHSHENAAGSAPSAVTPFSGRKHGQRFACGCGLAQQRVGGLHRGHHGPGGGLSDGGGVVGVLRLSAAVSLQSVCLGEHSLA